MHRQTPRKESDERTPAHNTPRTLADVDETSAESFPASDPPSWTSLRIGTPREPVRRTDERR